MNTDSIDLTKQPGILRKQISSSLEKAQIQKHLLKSSNARYMLANIILAALATLSNVRLYPQSQAYLRQYQAPTLVVWGKNDRGFLVEGADAYKCDLQNLEFHLFDTGHFALEENRIHLPHIGQARNTI